MLLRREGDGRNRLVQDRSTTAAAARRRSNQGAEPAEDCGAGSSTSVITGSESVPANADAAAKDATVASIAIFFIVNPSNWICALGLSDNLRWCKFFLVIGVDWLIWPAICVTSATQMGKIGKKPRFLRPV